MSIATSCVSTGHLPPAQRVQALVADAHARFQAIEDGRVADYIPALATVPRGLFGVCVVECSGLPFDSVLAIERTTDGSTNPMVVTTPDCRARAASAAPSSRWRPARAGLCTFAPPLDAAGNSVRGQLAARYLAERLGLNLLTSEASGASPS